MPLENLLKDLRIESSPADIYRAVDQTLQVPFVTVSDVTEAIAKQMSSAPTRAISDGTNQAWASAARRILETLIADEILTLDRRLVRPTKKLAVLVGRKDSAPPKGAP